MPGPFRWIGAFVLAALMALHGSDAACANTLEGSPADAPAASSEDSGTTPPDGGAPAADAAGEAPDQSGIDISVEFFGVGDRVRPGDWAGVRLALTDNASDKPRAVAVRFHTRDDDGDTQYTTRRITLNPGKPAATWLYVRIPKDTGASAVGAGTVFEVSVHATDPDIPSDPGNPGAGIGALIAARRFTPKTVVEPDRALIGVIGARMLGLEQYEMRSLSGGQILSSHEVTDIVPGIPLAGLPDAWVGLEQFEAIVWTEGNVDGLEPSRASALREWVYRGGHFVVVLPRVGSEWFTPSNPLLDIMPLVNVKRDEDASLAPYRAIFTARDFPAGELPQHTVVQSFVPAGDAMPAEASEIISGPEGCVVVRRLLGAGMVTVIGLDLQEVVRAAKGAFRADFFWHRVLGKRFDIPRGDDGTKTSNLGAGNLWTDALVGVAIAKQGAAGVGVLLGLLVFAAYWIIAAPGSFSILKRTNRVQHAWVVFFLTTLAFTFIAWAGATAIKPRHVEAQTLTYLDHVYGQPVDRARTWASVLLPSYGDQRVSIGVPGVDESWRQTMAVWSDPSSESRPTPFPDARGHTYDVQHLETMRVPARATVKQFQFDWVGGPRWSMPMPVSPGDAPRLVRLETKQELVGKLIHKLPGPLTDTTVILVVGQSTLSREAQEFVEKSKGAMPCRAYVWQNVANGGVWDPGVELDLSKYELKDNFLAEKFFGSDSMAPRSSTGALTGSRPTEDGASAWKYHYKAALYSMLEQPEWDKSSSNLSTMKRQAVHGMDLGKWFTQPCIIILGSLVNSPAPTPVYVHGVEIPSSGRTVIRWIYPLAPAPPVFAASKPAVQ